MLKSLVALCALAFLAGCAAPAPGVAQNTNTVADRPAAAPVDVGMDWHWRIVGDAAIRPVQVFTLRGQTFLQMQPGSRPVVLMVDGKVIPFTASAPYLIVQGMPGRIDVVRDGYRAVLQHEGGVDSGVVARAPSRLRRADFAAASAAAAPAAAAPSAAGASRIQRRRMN